MASQKRPRCSRRRQRGGTAISKKLLVRFPSHPLLIKERTIEQPNIEYNGYEAGDLKTLICTDPDAPGPNAPWLHWLVVNWKGAQLEVQSAEEIVAWAPPTPPPGSGVHRYQFRVFKQEGPIRSNPPAGRAAFPLDSFVAEHRLIPLAETTFRVAAAAAAGAAATATALKEAAQTPL
jgi:phosphatidylethanolamine-binding protein (PEBP) family uncharacterized protein